MSDFKAKMHQIRFLMGLCPRPGELTALPQALWQYLRGPTFKGSGGKGKERGKDLPDQCQTASYTCLYLQVEREA